MVIKLIILLAGLVIYAGYGLYGLIWLIAATMITWLAGFFLPKYRWLKWPLIALNGALLVIIKLQPVTGWGILAPLGVSYFTLQIISYIVDVSKAKYAPERNILTFGLYLAYFPHLLFGPIEPFDRMKETLARRRFSWDGISAGGARAVWGLFKTYAIAARAGVITSTIAAAPDTYKGAYALLAMLLYSIQLYANFSGGIDIVLGVSQMLGMPMSENFNTPYFAQSFAEFWRRWHITLGAWLRNYIYIPLGGNRKGPVRKVVNTILTFLVSGLWHGVHYILWGLFNGIFVAVGERCRTRWKWLNCAVTFLLISILWSFFVWPDTFTALRAIGSLFTTFNYADLGRNILSLGLGLGEWIAFLGSLALLWAYDLLRERIKGWFAKASPALRIGAVCLVALLVLIFGMYGIGFVQEQFIYSKF